MAIPAESVFFCWERKRKSRPLLTSSHSYKTQTIDFDQLVTLAHWGEMYILLFVLDSPSSWQLIPPTLVHFKCVYFHFPYVWLKLHHRWCETKRGVRNRSIAWSEKERPHKSSSTPPNQQSALKQHFTRQQVANRIDHRTCHFFDLPLVRAL